MKKSTKKRIIKILIILIIVFINLNFLNINAYEGIGPGEGTDATGTEKVREAVNTILGIFQFIGITTAVIMIVYIGIDYFSKSHDPQERANLHKKFSSIFLGLIFILAATGILTLIKELIVKETSSLSL